MTPQEMQKRSAQKVKQVMGLMEMLHLKVEARQKVDVNTGFIDLTVFWIDGEPYPASDGVVAEEGSDEKINVEIDIPAPAEEAPAPAEEVA